MLIKVGTYIGTARTIALVVLTGVLGAWMAREQGLRVVREFNDAIQRGDMPANPLIDGLLIVVGGVLLVTPGILTDIVGFILVIPQSRRLIRTWLEKYLRTRVDVMTSRSGFSGFYYSSSFPEDDAERRKRDDDDDIIDV